MNAIKSVQDFKEFLETNLDLLYSNAVKADDTYELCKISKRNERSSYCKDASR